MIACPVCERELPENQCLPQKRPEWKHIDYTCPACKSQWAVSDGLAGTIVTVRYVGRADVEWAYDEIDRLRAVLDRVPGDALARARAKATQAEKELEVGGRGGPECPGPIAPEASVRDAAPLPPQRPK